MINGPSDPDDRRDQGTPPAPGPRPGRAWRSAGIAALGLVGGVLLALVVQDLLAVALVRDGTVPVPLAAALALLVPALAVLGAVVAVLVDGRYPKRGRRGPTDE